MADFGRYTVGYYAADINDWYFDGEYGEVEAARRCARKAAGKNRARARVTDHATGRVEYFNPETDR